MSNKKFNIITSNEEVAVLTSKTVSNKFILNAYNSYEYESGVNSLIFNLTSNEANISLYDENTNINNKMIELNNNEININSNIWLRNSINSCNINLYGNLLITGNVNDIKSEEINYLSGLTKNISNNFVETSNYLDLNEINKENTSNHLNLLDYKINSNLVETYNIIENSNINISNYILNIESKTSNIEVIENGNIKLNSDLVINGKISTDIISSDDNNIIFTKSIIPSVNNLLDLGTPEYKFRDLYVGNNSLWIGDGASLSASEEGSMKVKKRKKGIPSIILNLTPQPSEVDNHLDGVKYYNPNQGISSLDDVKIYHWIKYYEILTGLENITANDLFGNDTEEVSATDGWIDSNNNLILNSTEYQKIGIGTNNPNVILDIISTNAIKLPVGNNNERPNTTGIDNLGYIRYNNEEQCFEGYENYGSEYRWQHIGGVRDRDKDTYITAENCGHEHDEYIDTDVLSFYTDGEKRMTISKTGNVGIGNNFIAANKDLEVSGDVDINGTLYTQHLIVSGTSTEINTTYNNTSSINIENNGTDTTLLVKQTGEKNILETYYNDFNTFIIKNNCNIGISFDNPEFKLDINGGDFNIRDGNIRINCEELSTDHLIEGNVNLFYTTDRFNVAFDNKLQTITTADILENITSQYYTESKVNANFNTKTTDLLSEGNINLYYTNDRVFSTLTNKNFYFNNLNNIGINTNNPTEKLHVNGNILANNIIGNGSQLTNLNANEIVSGKINNNRLPYDISVSTISGNGSALTDLNANNISSGKINNNRLPNNISVSTISGDGSGLTNLNANEIFSGKFNNDRLPNNINISGNLQSTKIISDGSDLTNLNANNISSGKINNDRLPNNILVSTISGDGSGLTNLNAENIYFGTINNNLLPDNINVESLSGNGSGLTNLNANNILSGKINNSLLNDNVSINNNLNIINGNIGIGREAVSNKLEIEGDAYIKNNLTIDGNFNVLGTFTTTNTDNIISESIVLNNNGSTTTLSINQLGNKPILDIKYHNANILFIDDGGKIGIRKNNPTSDLDINGDINFNGTINNITVNQLNQLNDIDTSITIQQNFNITSNHIGELDENISNYFINNESNILITSNHIGELDENISNYFIDNELNILNTLNEIDLLDTKFIQNIDILTNNTSNYIRNIEPKTSNISILENGNIKLNSDLTIDNNLIVNNITLNGTINNGTIDNLNLLNGQDINIKENFVNTSNHIGELDIKFIDKTNIIENRVDDFINFQKVNDNLIKLNSSFTVNNDLTINGNFNVTGEFNVLDTEVKVSDKFVITNDGTDTAFIVNQKGNDTIVDIQSNDISVFYILNNGNIGINNTNPTEKLDINGNIKAINIIGNGSQLTNLNANNISSGTISSDRLPLASQSIVGGVKVDNNTILIDNNGVISGAAQYGNNDVKTLLNTGIDTNINTSGNIIGNGSQLTNLNANNISSGILPIIKGGTGATDIETARANLNVDIAGTINYTLPVATTSVLGGVKVDGTTITIDNGIISGTPQYGDDEVKSLLNTNLTGGLKVSSGDVIIDGGVGVNSSGVLHIRQKGNTNADGIALTSSHGTSHRIWKNSSGILSIGCSTDTDIYQFRQDINGNIGIGIGIDTNYKLNVGGNINFTGNLTHNGLAFSSYTDNDVKYYLENITENLGIGKEPTEKLDVNGNIKFSGNIIGNGSSLTDIIVSQSDFDLKFNAKIVNDISQENWDNKFDSTSKNIVSLISSPDINDLIYYNGNNWNSLKLDNDTLQITSDYKLKLVAATSNNLTFIGSYVDNNNYVDNLEYITNIISVSNNTFVYDSSVIDTNKLKTGDIINLINTSTNENIIKKVYNSTDTYFTIYSDSNIEDTTTTYVYDRYIKQNYKLLFNVVNTTDILENPLNEIENTIETKFTCLNKFIYNININIIFDLTYGSDFCKFYIKLKRNNVESYINILKSLPITDNLLESATINYSILLNLEINDIITFESNYKIKNGVINIIPDSRGLSIQDITTVSKNIIPNVDNGIDLGSVDYKFRDIYVSNNSLWIGDHHKIAVSHDGNMKIRKRKTDLLPPIIIDAGGNNSDIINYVNTNHNANVTSVSELGLKHLLEYARTLTGLENVEINEIFRDNDQDYENEAKAIIWNELNTNIYYNLGNVGVGTSNPSNKLSIKTGTNYDGIILNNENDKILFKVARSTTSQNCYLALYDGITEEPKITLSNTGNCTFNSGNIGIGTTSPSYKLDVNDKVRLENAVIGDIGHGTTYCGFIHSSLNAANKYALLQSSGGDTYLNCATGKNVNFRIENSTKMQLNSNGNIGIGTTSPAEKIEINGWIGRTAHNSGALCGSYNNISGNGEKTNPIYVIGSSYKPQESSLDNMYGIGYSHTNASFINSDSGSGWGMYVASDGDARIFMNSTTGKISCSDIVKQGHTYTQSLIRSYQFYATGHPTSWEIPTLKGNCILHVAINNSYGTFWGYGLSPGTYNGTFGYNYNHGLSYYIPYFTAQGTSAGRWKGWIYNANNAKVQVTEIWF